MIRTYKEYKDIVEKHLQDFLPCNEDDDSTLQKAMAYSIKNGGKRLRPVLLLASCEMSGGNIIDAIPFACAIEYIHTYSLIHDDLPAIDNDDLRRGMPTNHIIFGDAMAILAGDGLLSLAFDIMIKNIMQCIEKGNSSTERVKALNVISDGAGKLVEGEASDIESENSRISLEKLKNIHSNKTGALITSAVKAGMYLGNANENMIMDFENFAECFGLAFQIKDDILDVTATTEEIGKPVGSDEEKNKSTYVSIYGLDGAQKELENALSIAETCIAKYNDSTFFNDLIKDFRH